MNGLKRYDLGFGIGDDKNELVDNVHSMAKTIDVPMMMLSKEPTLQSGQIPAQVPPVLLIDKVVADPIANAGQVPTIQECEKTVAVPQVLSYVWQGGPRADCDTTPPGSHHQIVRYGRKRCRFTSLID